MFVRNWTRMPEDPKFSEDLTKLGYQVNEKGEFVSIDDPTQHFTFFHTNNERVNEKRKEAFHGCVRKMVKAELAKEGVKEVYLTGKGGVEVKEVKPSNQHLPILVTEPQVLKDKKDVIIVIGEHTQDLGVWAWRVLAKEGGIDDGSAVGLAKKLQSLEIEPLPEVITPTGFLFHDAAVREKAYQSAAMQRTDSAITVSSPKAPGLVILNPGQRLYSHEHGTAMTQPTWHARDWPNALSGPHQVHEEHNHIQGHKTPKEHINTVFDHVLPQLLNKEARYWIVGIADGAEEFIKYMDARMVVNENADIANRVTGFAFMQPTHDPMKVESVPLRQELYVFGRCWVKCDAAKGSWLNSPNATKPFKYSSSEDDSPTREETEQKEGAKTQEVEDAKAREAAETLIQMSQSGIESLGPEPQHESDSSDEDESETGGVPVIIERSGNALRESANLSNSQGSFASPKSLEGWAGDPPQLSKQSMESLASSQKENPPANTTAVASPVSVAEKDAEVDTTELEQSISDLNIPNKEGEANAAKMYGNYDAFSEKVSCPTFSSGVTDHDELIFPAVMDEVLGWFKQYARGLALPGGRAMEVEMAGRDMETFARTF